LLLKKIFENCFIQSLNEILNVNDYFYDKFEKPWRKLIHYIFKQYTDGMISEDMLNEFLIKYKIK
jgi:hypothetical protein